MRSTKSGFTLIELLVVVTIIVVLLAMLTPALDRAIYSAEMAICETRLHGIAAGVNLYAWDFKRHYPYRSELKTLIADSRPQLLRNPLTTSGDDDRLVIRERVPLKLYLDPLAGKVSLDPEQTLADSYVYASYSLWYGWQYTSEPHGMNRLGDRMSWNDKSFSVLASDMDALSKGGEGTWAQNSHPDANGFLVNVQWQDVLNPPRYTCAWWATNNGSSDRGLLDRSFVFDDASVKRLTDVQVNRQGKRDDRVIEIPLRLAENAGTFEYLPAQ